MTSKQLFEPIFPTILQDPPFKHLLLGSPSGLLNGPQSAGEMGKLGVKEGNQTGGGRGLCLAFGSSVGLNGLWRVVVVWESSESLNISWSWEGGHWRTDR